MVTIAVTESNVAEKLQGVLVATTYTFFEVFTLTQAVFQNYLATALRMVKLQFGPDQDATYIDYYNEAANCKAACLVIEVGLKPQLLKGPMNYSPASGVSISKEGVARQLDEVHKRWQEVWETFCQQIQYSIIIDTPAKQTFRVDQAPTYGDDENYGPYNDQAEED